MPARKDVPRFFDPGLRGELADEMNRSARVEVAVAVRLLASRPVVIASTSIASDRVVFDRRDPQALAEHVRGRVLQHLGA